MHLPGVRRVPDHQLHLGPCARRRPAHPEAEEVGGGGGPGGDAVVNLHVGRANLFIK